MKMFSKLFLTLSLSLMSVSVSAKIYDSFMCYTQVNTVVIFGVLKEMPYVDIHYQRLDKRSVRLPLKVVEYNRATKTIIVYSKFKGKKVVDMKSVSGQGTTDIDLTMFEGTEDTEFSNEDVLCYFGQVQD